MNLQTYINLYQILDTHNTTHESNRTFALDRQLRDADPKQKLLPWTEEHKTKLPTPLLSEQFCKYLYAVSLTLAFISLALGFVAGVGLLSYSGKEPVNIIYFLAVAVFFPLVTMLLGFLSMLKASSAQNLLVHISPAYWMEKLLSFLPHRIQGKLSELKINPLLLNWLVIKRAQLLSLLFALGLFLALLGIVTTKDVAFAWSTTLQVSAEQFHSFLQMLSWPWRTWLPSAVPSLELIEQSQYFRLGGKLGSDMVSHASLLGEWWRFLACATLVYAIVLRLLVWLLANYGFQEALSRSLLKIEGVERLLYQMDTPIVSTTAPKQEFPAAANGGQYGRILYTKKNYYTMVLGWAMISENISLLNDSMQINTEKYFSVGGSNTLQEDYQILQGINGDVLLYVKVWEPPTMDIIDFLHDLADKAEHITIMAVGTVDDKYRVNPRELDIWGRKLYAINNPKVWLWKSS